ncbi:MAG: type 2 lanthipeptide synthetase LanM family protein [Nostoc sp.]
MEVSQQDVLKIVEKASTIPERLGDVWRLRLIADTALEKDELTCSRLKKWCQAVAKGNWEKFAKRLAWDDLNIETVCKVLGRVHLADAQQLPAWAENLQEILQGDLKKVDKVVYRCLIPEDPIPFEEIFLPFVQVARQKLIAQTGASYQLLSESAHISLERSLLVRLSSVCAQSLQMEFSAFRLLKQSSLSCLLGQLQDSLSKEQYQEFINSLTTEGLLSFFQMYSVLARLVTTAMNFWLEATTEFLQRLTSDLSIIQQTFLEDTGEVVAIQPFLSDPHNRGRCAIALSFASGLKLVYKPKNLALEAAYFQLLAWCNQQKVLLPFQLLKVINCNTYGWVEYVEHLPCENEIAAQRYYKRAGMLLCLLYVLGASDCHFENLIASGEHLMLVDMETLMHPDANEIGDKKTHSSATQEFQDSVLRTGLLPRWEFGADKQIYDISGLGSVSEQKFPFPRPEWQHINTDNMTLGYKSGTISTKANAPYLNGITLSPNDYVDEIVDGFQQMYQFLVQRREALLATDSPLANLAHQQVRFVFRGTKIYGQLQSLALQPKFMQDGADRSIELDVLSRMFLTADTKPIHWSLLAAEIQALEQLDIPYFTAESTSDSLILSSDLTITKFFKEPSYNRVISNLQQLNNVDLAQQIEIIQVSLCSRVADELDSNAQSWNLDVIAALTPAQMVEEAVAIAQELENRAIHADSSVTWIGMKHIREVGRLQPQPLGYSLYDGVCGVALFLAALAKITGDRKWRDLALKALQPLKKTLLQPEITQQIGIGGATGIGSIIYALVRVSQFLNESQLLEVAKLAASRITQESIVGDSQFDTMAGAGGAILGLLALHQATLEQIALEQAIACGHHLLNNRVTSDSEFRAWVTGEDKLLTGFSHGAAGIAYALLRLYKTTQELNFLKAAESAIAYERSVFSPAAGNWPDLRAIALTQNKPFMTSWCHGAPGIGLARLGGLMILDTTEIRQEIGVALNTTQQFGLEARDNLCCGNFGRIEVLLVAAQKLSQPKLWETAQKQAARAKQADTSQFSKLPGDAYNPSFFQGIAGIGYQLLRLAYPDLLPSVLLWE